MIDVFRHKKIVETLAQQRGEARDAKMAFQLIYRQPRNQPDSDRPKIKLSHSHHLPHSQQMNFFSKRTIAQW